jgi:predicted transcriptional regulator
LTLHDKDEAEVYQFLMEEIDSVPHLEALLLLWNTRPQGWSQEKLAERLYVSQSVADRLLQDLVRQGVVGETESGLYSYNSKLQERNRIIGLLDARYRKEVVRISTLIHSKPSSSLRDFARAFRFTKERE